MDRSVARGAARRLPGLSWLLLGLGLLLLIGLPRQAQQPPWACLPPAVTDLRVNVVDGAATLYWTVPHQSAALRPPPKVRAQPASQTGALITGWQYSPNDGQDWYDIPGSDADTRSYQVRGLTPGQTYRFRVRALNRFGAGPSSNRQLLTLAPRPTATPRPRSGATAAPTATPGVRPPPTPAATATRTPTPQATPGPVTGLAGTPGPNRGQVTLRWSTPTTGGRVASYDYYVQRQGSASGQWQAMPGSDGRTTTFTYTVPNPQHYGTVHLFAVRARNGRGIGTASGQVQVRPQSPSPTPTDTATTGAGPSPTPMATATATHTATNTDTLTATPTATATYTITNTPTSGPSPTPSDTATATNTATPTDTPTATITPTPESAPLTPTLNSAVAGTGQVTLTWTAATTGGAASSFEYFIRNTTVQPRDNGRTVAVPGSTGSTTSYVVTQHYGRPLVAGHSYVFSVRARNARGASPYSNSLFATPQ